MNARNGFNNAIFNHLILNLVSLEVNTIQFERFEINFQTESFKAV